LIIDYLLIFVNFLKRKNNEYPKSTNYEKFIL